MWCAYYTCIISFVEYKGQSSGWKDRRFSLDGKASHCIIFVTNIVFNLVQGTHVSTEVDEVEVPKDAQKEKSRKYDKLGKGWYQNFKYVQAPIGLDQVPGWMSILCRHVTPAANSFWWNLISSILVWFDRRVVYVSCNSRIVDIHVGSNLWGNETSLRARKPVVLYNRRKHNCSLKDCRNQR